MRRALHLDMTLEIQMKIFSSQTNIQPEWNSNSTHKDIRVMVSNAVGTENKYPSRNLFFVNTVEKFKNPEYRLASFQYRHFYILSRYGVIFGSKITFTFLAL